MSATKKQRLVKKMVAKIVSTIPPKIVKRRKGCPRGGRVTFSKAQVESIPEQSSQSSLARALGVRVPSIQQWFKAKRNPLPHTLDSEDRPVFFKQVVVKWLIATRRYRVKKSA